MHEKALQISPIERARESLDNLFHQAIGIPWKPFGTPNDGQPPAGGDAVAAEEYARLICQHVENLNKLAKSHRSFILPVSRKRYTWPVLRSKHPGLSEDEKAIIRDLEVGCETGRYLDEYSKWEPFGKIPYLVDEILDWVEACWNPPPPFVYVEKRRVGTRPPWKTLREFRSAEGTSSVYICANNFCPHPVIARLSDHLRPREEAARSLKPLTAKVLKPWNELIDSLLEDCFRDPDCANYLSSHFAAASKRKNRGSAKAYLLQKIRIRLKALSGVK